jgi:hypothetical protein
MKEDIQYTDFRAVEWDAAAGLVPPTSSSDSNWPLLYFNFYNAKDLLTLYLWLRPGPPEENRNRIRDLVKQTDSVFRNQRSTSRGWYCCYEQPFLTVRDYAKYTDDALKAVIDKEWQQFVDQSLPAITDVFRRQDWFWHPPAS